jgi:hypothetical protein
MSVVSFVSKCGRALIGCALMSLTASEAAAQICAGGPAFNFAPLQIVATVGASDRGPLASASVGMGTDFLFGLVSFAGLSGRGDDPNMRVLTVSAGTEQPMRVDNRLRFCPGLSLTHARRDGQGDTGLSGHLALGWVARNREYLMIVPSGALAIKQLPESSPSRDVLQRAFELDWAVGVIFNTLVAVTPRLSVAWPRDSEAVTTLSLTAHVGFR